jgi:hypothetical protein
MTRSKLCHLGLNLAPLVAYGASSDWPVLQALHQGFWFHCRPSHSAPKKDTFIWSDAANVTFEALKQALTVAYVLHLPDFTKEFMVDCDASGSGFGVVLHQGDGPITYFSRQFAPRHLKITAYERELIGVQDV